MFFVLFQIKMAQEPTYLAPVIPKTPSSKINEMLEERCGNGFHTLPRALVGYYVCGVFSAIARIYSKIHRSTTRESYTHWVSACLILAVLCMVTCYALLNVTYFSIYVFQTILNYIGAVVVFLTNSVGCVFTTCLKFSGILFSTLTFSIAAMGVAFFDKKGSVLTKKD